MGSDRYPNLFSPGEIGSLRSKNRIVMSSMCDNMADRQGRVTDQKIAYLRRRAKGGVGWINLGYAYTTPAGRGCTYFQVGIYEDGLIPGMWRLTEAIHEYDTRIGCQLAAAGRSAGSSPVWPATEAKPALLTP